MLKLISFMLLLSFVSCNPVIQTTTTSEQESNTETPVLTPDVQVPVPETTPTPTPVASNNNYPFYFPMSGLKAPTDIRYISCSKSNAAGELRDMKNEPVVQYNAELFTGIEYIYEAPCTYKNMGPAGIRNWKWADGSQVIHRTSSRGSKAIFSSDDNWVVLRFNPGETQGRFHAEVIDLELKFTNNIQVMGSLHFEVYPNASSGQLATLVVRDSVIEGGKNGIFIPGGASMTYVENTKVGRNVGTNIDQEHVTYINGVISTHFKNVSFYGSNAGGGAGGHILKNKAAIRILESVTLDNAKSKADNSIMPLGDFSSFGYTWSENLVLLRRKAAVGNMRDTVIDVREDRYFEPNGPVKMPFMDAKGASMPSAPPGCTNLLDNPDQSYWHVFNNTVLDSAIKDTSVFRLNGIVSTEYSGIFPTATYDDIVANPRRQRAILLTNKTFHSAEKTNADGYYYLKPSYPTYHCENATPGPNVSAITSSRDKFIQYALKRIRSANPAMPQLPGI